jgi:tRNA A37 threonylcarbamoyladenosine synthetase subunit TsaC/SUA5/YrdC
VISPGDVCPSNALVGDILDLIGEDILYITSANTSSHVSKQTEAAHFEMREIQREFGHRGDVVLIGHRNERANRRRYPHHLPCSTSIIAFHTGELVLERLGSLDTAAIADVTDRHGLPLRIAAGASQRVPVRKPARSPLARQHIGASRKHRIHA